jgi:hypothetical protein
MITTVTRPIISLFERSGGITNIAKMDTNFVKNIVDGRPNRNLSYLLAAETNDLKTNYFLDERGQMKYKLVTGKLVDIAM